MQNDWMRQLHAISHELQAVSDRCAQLAGDLHYVIQKAEEARRMNPQVPAAPMGYSYGSAYRQGTTGQVGSQMNSASTGVPKQSPLPVPRTWDSPKDSGVPVVSGVVDGVQESWTVGSLSASAHAPHITGPGVSAGFGTAWGTNSGEYSAARQSEYTQYTRM